MTEEDLLKAVQNMKIAIDVVYDCQNTLSNLEGTDFEIELMDWMEHTLSKLRCQLCKVRGE